MLASQSLPETGSLLSTEADAGRAALKGACTAGVETLLLRSALGSRTTRLLGDGKANAAAENALIKSSRQESLDVAAQLLKMHLRRQAAFLSSDQTLRALCSLTSILVRSSLSSFCGRDCEKNKAKLGEMRGCCF